MAATGAAMSFCATSNLFLGSGLFDLRRRACGRRARGPRHRRRRRHDAFDAAHDGRVVQGLPARRPVAVAAAGVLSRDAGRRGRRSISTIGSATSTSARRPISSCSIRQRRRILRGASSARTTLDERLFAFMILGDDRAVHATHVLGARRMLGRVPERAIATAPMERTLLARHADVLVTMDDARREIADGARVRSRQPDRARRHDGRAAAVGRYGDRARGPRAAARSRQHPSPHVPDAHPRRAGGAGQRALRLAEGALSDLGAAHAGGDSRLRAHGHGGAPALRLHDVERSPVRVSERLPARRHHRRRAGHRPSLPSPRAAR